LSPTPLCIERAGALNKKLDYSKLTEETMRSAAESETVREARNLTSRATNRVYWRGQVGDDHEMLSRREIASTDLNHAIRIVMGFCGAIKTFDEILDWLGMAQPDRT